MQRKHTTVVFPLVVAVTLAAAVVLATLQFNQCLRTSSAAHFVHHPVPLLVRQGSHALSAEMLFDVLSSGSRNHSLEGGLRRPTAQPEVPRNLTPGFYIGDEIFDETCIDSWRLRVPFTYNASEFNDWLTRERPYGGCTLKNNKTECEFEGGCSNYQVAHHAYVPYGAIGSCGSQPRLDVLTAKPDEKCDGRTFVPLNLPESLFFGHLETLFTKLVRVIARGDHVNALFYIRRHFSMSQNVLAILRRMNISFVTEYPHGVCFSRVIWVCHSVSIDPGAVQNISRVLRSALSLTKEESKALPVLADTNRKACTRIYFARNSKGARNGRFINYESSFAAELWRKHGFCVINGDVPFNITSDTMSRAKVLVAAHGGALMNMMWLDPRHEPIVIELDGYQKYAKYWLLASALGYRYGWMSFNPKTGIDANKLMELLRKVERSSTLLEALNASQVPL